MLGMFFGPAFTWAEADNLDTSELSNACVNDTQKCLTSPKKIISSQN